VPAAALGLALGAAFLHAVWNVMLRRAVDVEAATAVTLVISVVAFAPPAALTWHASAAVVPYAIASAALELVYFILLAAAYRRLELSVVYPIARGSAPVLVLLAGVAVLGRTTSVAEAFGVGAVAAGIFLVRGPRGDLRGIATGLAIGACIAGYTLVDKGGIAHASALAYLELILAPPAVLYAAAIAFLRGRAALRAEVRVSNAVIAIASMAAFTLVLLALRMAPAASVSAVRETSVVIATVLAAMFLRERVTRSRLAGAVLVAGGVALLALS
jgi:drug/metabolite transporter (DMT)-like permease